MLEKFTDSILNLPKKEKYDKTDLLTSTFLINHENSLEIYYAPHNEIINLEAKIVIVGITPGWNQMNQAFQTAKFGLESHWNTEKIKRECKKTARFAGSMRKNLIEMLDELHLQKYLKLESCADLFNDQERLLHTTSLIPYPVFNSSKNYTGAHPSILDSSLLLHYVHHYFYKEIAQLPNTLIIPLGKAVEEVLKIMIEEGQLEKERCLFGFPHPSGANGHRQKQFLLEKTLLQKQLKQYFNA